MLAARFYVIYTILWLFASISSATTDPVCDSVVYGQPTYSDCRDLVAALQRGDDKLRFFSLRSERAPSWIPIAARDQPSRLPQLMDRGELVSASHIGDYLRHSLGLPRQLQNRNNAHSTSQRNSYERLHVMAGHLGGWALDAPPVCRSSEGCWGLSSYWCESP